MQDAIGFITENGNNFLEQLGYREENGIYRILRANKERVALFCHTDFARAWMSVLLHIPVHILWAGFELDDTYFGKHKKGVVVAVSKTEDGKPCYIKMQVVPNLTETTIGKFANQNTTEGARIQKDAYHSYRKPLAEKHEHQYEVFDV